MRRLLIVLALCSVAFAADVPKISADMGSCSAAFTVRGPDGKPVYNAKIYTLIKHGAFGWRKLELEVHTDSNGRADVVKLPNYARKPIVFDVTSGSFSATQPFDPESSCNAQFPIKLE